MCGITQRERIDVWNTAHINTFTLAGGGKGTLFSEVIYRWGKGVGTICDIVHHETDAAVFFC